MWQHNILILRCEAGVRGLIFKDVEICISLSNCIEDYLYQVSNKFDHKNIISHTKFATPFLPLGAEFLEMSKFRPSK